MQSLSDDEKREVLGEVLSDQLKAILEYVQDIPGIKRKLSEVDERLIRVEDRLLIVETIVREHETDLRIIKQQLALA